MVVAEAELTSAVARDRAAGKRVGCARLAFDLLRVDHVRLLQAVAGQVDRLVVAVIDDQSQHVVRVSDRAEIVDGVRGVDYVTVCAPDRVEPLVTLLRPDVLA